MTLMLFSGACGEDEFVKKLKQKISWHCLFKAFEEKPFWAVFGILTDLRWQMPYGRKRMPTEKFVGNGLIP